MQLTLVMDEQDVRVEYDENGNKIQKVIDLADFQKAVNSVIKTEFPLLPYGTRYIFSKKNIYVIAVEKPAQIRTLNYRYNDKTIKKEVHFPCLLFIFRIENKKMTHSRLYAMEHSLVKLNQMLYYFPFSNADPK